MLTQEQFELAEAAAREVVLPLVPAELTAGTIAPATPAAIRPASELEWSAQEDLSDAIQCLARQDRRGARVAIQRALDLLNEAELV